MDIEKFEVAECPDGGFNFGVKDNKANALDKITVNTQIRKNLLIITQFVYKEDTGYGVYECEDDEENPLKLTGTFPKTLDIGQTYDITGKVTIFRGEKQISCEAYKIARPTGKRGVIAFLKQLRGLDAKAELIYELYGDESIDVLLADPVRVSKEVKGVGKKSVLAWKEQLEKLKGSQEVMTKLLEYGLSVRHAKIIFEKFKEGVVYKIEENPYFLSDELNGFAFQKCDTIAKNLGYDPKGIFRIQEGLKHTLNEASYEGHCFLPINELIKRAKELLDVKLTVQEMKTLIQRYDGSEYFIYKVGAFEYNIEYCELVEQYKIYNRDKYSKEDHRFSIVDIQREEIIKETENLSQFSKLIFEDGKVFLPSIYESENKVVERILEIAVGQTQEFGSSEQELEALMSERGISLEAKQKEAVIEFSKGKGGFFILNGSAGCGKTFTLKIILEILETQYKNSGERLSVKVFAPTGKASKVASKATGRECSTVHRGLRYNPISGFEFNENTPLEADCVVVDESSMLDVNLAKSLLCAIGEGTKVIFLGDTKQLPSVGPGNILHDLIESGIVKVVTLNVVKRQGEQSGIIRNANKIINDEMISSCRDTKDAYVIKKDNLYEAQKGIIASVKDIRRVKQYSIDDIQVLCPQKSGDIGTYVMNYLMQAEFNPGERGLKVLNKKIKMTNYELGQEEVVSLYFKSGDKVIHMKNNYSMIWYNESQFFGYQEDLGSLGITNGECGVIVDIVKEEHFDTFKTKIIVKYEDKYVFYEDVFDELEHAYALTIHKSQGSQWKAVVIPMMKQNFMMLDNNLFYTGYTRAQEFIVIVGQEEAMAQAIRSHKTRTRYTGLYQKLKNTINKY